MKKILFFIAIGALVIWSLVTYWAPPGIVAIVALVIWAFRSDTKMWKTKPTAELVALIEGNDWAQWQNALQELHRRGEDISRFTPRLVARLVSDSVLSRTAADAALKEVFPEFKEHLKGYLPTHAVTASRQRLEQLLVKYGVEA